MGTIVADQRHILIECTVILETHMQFGLVVIHLNNTIIDNIYYY